MASTILKLGQKIRKWRNLSGFKTQYKFWRLVNPEIKSSHASAYESPNSKEDVPLKYLPDVARVLKVPIERLRDPNVQDYPQSLDPWIIYKTKPVADLLPHERLIPVLSNISHDGSYAPADVSASEVLPQSINTGALGDFFALPMRGDSNAPKIESGDIVIFRKITTLNNIPNGAVALFFYNNAPLIRAVYFPELADSGKVILKALNSDQDIYPKIIIREIDHKISTLIGVGVAVVKSLPHPLA